MAWNQPKTDWAGGVDTSGTYKGDYFNAADYNRIKNNIAELHRMGNALYMSFGVENMGTDKEVGSYFYADEINKIENNLDTICRKTIPTLTGKKKVFAENTAMINFEELNRIEKCCLALYENMTNQAAGRKRLSFRLGGGRF